MTAPLNPLIPTVDTTLTAQTGQFDQNAQRGESVLQSLAKPATKALQAEINSAAALKNPAYTRP